MELTNSFPPVDGAFNKLKQFDYVKFGNNAIKFSVTAYAIAVGVVSYLWTVFQLWWDDNGEAVKINTIRLVVNVIDTIAAIVITAPKVYRWMQLNSNRAADSIFFQVTGA